MTSIAHEASKSETGAVWNLESLPYLAVDHFSSRAIRTHVQAVIVVI